MNYVKISENNKIFVQMERNRDHRGTYDAGSYPSSGRDTAKNERIIVYGIFER